MLYRKWQTKQYDAQDVYSLAKELGVQTLLAKVLLSKGAKNKKEAQELFLNDFKLSDPFLLKDMDIAVERIHTAIEKEEKIVVYGDYDVDGVCATALLFSCLESMGANVFYKLPSRESEGYGLNANVLQLLKRKGVDLVITVDNGISAIEEIDLAQKIGLDVIVTDHHIPKGELPNAVAIVDPLRLDDTSPCKILSGVGVAFKLACALENALCSEMLEFYADFVAVGTVADLMLLEGENRTMVKAGLELLNTAPRQGFLSLINVCGLTDKEITSESIGYAIGPRINAAGRMGDATCALELLLSDDEGESTLLANELESENQKRQETQNKMAEDITNDILNDPNLVKDRVIVVWSEDYHPGVVGIVASKLVEKYAKPAIILTKDGEDYKGSGRSVSCFNLHKALEKTKDLLVKYGGHRLAAGLTLKKENLANFRQAINKVANEDEALAITEPLLADCEISLAEVNTDSVTQINYLAPFGNGNETPLFNINNVQLMAVFPISDGKHIRLKLKQEQNVLQGVMFNISPQEFAYTQGDMLDITANLSLYQTDTSSMVSVKIKEVRPHNMSDEIIDSYDVYKLFLNGYTLQETQKKELCPSREDIACIYRYLLSTQVPCDDLRPIFVKFNDMKSGKIQLIVDILLEMGLIEKSDNISKNHFKAIKVAQKKDLSQSAILQRVTT